MGRTESGRDGLREAVERLAYASDDGTEREHNGHGSHEGEPECPGCWAESIQHVLAMHPPTPAEEPAEVAVGEREALDAILVALWQCETERGFEHMAAKVHARFAALTAKAKVEGRVDALREALLSIRTHNLAPVTPEHLRYAATHEALNRFWIFDVLTGLADRIDGGE